MFAIISNGLCCCCGATANMTKSAFSKSIKLSYIGISVFYSFLLIIATSFGDVIVKAFAQFIGCPTDDDLSICLGISLIVRVSMALMILHIILGILLFTRDGFAKFINEECFLLKIILVLVLVIVLMFFNNDYLLFFVQASKYISVIFLVYQSIMLIDFGYVWNELWVEKYENGTTFYGILLLLFSILLFALNITIISLNIKEFWISGCYLNKFSLIFAIIMLVVFFVLVLLKLNDQSSILTALFVSLLYSYLSGYSLTSQTDRQCNPQQKVEQISELIYGFIFHILINLTLGFITVSFASISEKSSQNFKNAKLDKIHVQENEEDEELIIETNQNTSLQIYQTNSFIIFHMMMAIFSIYLIQIFFDWKNLNLDFDTWKELDNKSNSGFWYKFLNSILILVVYLWTLIAPSILDDREF